MSPFYLQGQKRSARLRCVTHGTAPWAGTSGGHFRRAASFFRPRAAAGKRLLRCGGGPGGRRGGGWGEEGGFGAANIGAVREFGQPRGVLKEPVGPGQRYWCLLGELLGFRGAPSHAACPPPPQAAMSLQWTVVATFLYAEVFLVLLLCVPFVSPTR